MKHPEKLAVVYNDRKHPATLFRRSILDHPIELKSYKKNHMAALFPRFDAYESTVPEHSNARGRVVSDEFPSSCGNLGSGSKKTPKVWGCIE